MKRFFPLLLLLLPSRVALAQDDVKSALHELEGQTLVLRNPIRLAGQKYSSSGHPIGLSGSKGVWATDGVLLIRKVKMRRHTLRIDAERLGIEYDSHKDALVARPRHQSARIDIQLDNGAVPASQLQSILRNIFFLDRAALIASVPPFWKDYMASHLESYGAGSKSGMTFRSGRTPLSSIEAAVNGELVYRVGKEIKAPHGTYNPDPSYTEDARIEHLSGTVDIALVVDKNGDVVRAEIVKPLGLGLDEASVATARTWKFDPATRDGQPVNVLIEASVSFTLR